MKIFGYGLTLLLLTLIATTAAAQTITSGQLDRTIYCAGDSITVDYTTTGAFMPGNVFLIQMADTADDFTARFYTIGTVTATASGSIRGRLPEDIIDVRSPTIFRFRVVSSNPVVIGSDNGADIELLDDRPVEWYNPRYGVAGHPVSFTAAVLRATGHSWDFGPGSNPRIVNQPGGSYEEHVAVTTFDSPGIKNVVGNGTSEGGCSRWEGMDVEIFSPNVTLPGTVTIVQGEMTLEDLAPGQADFWVCPGGKLTLKDWDQVAVTIYAEFGSVVNLDRRYSDRVLVYARKGANIVFDRDHPIVLYEDGASLSPLRSEDSLHLKVATLTFDYSSVPPGGCPSLAPYTVEIKPSSNGIHTESNENGSDQHYRVYGEGDLTISGDRNTYYLDEGSALELRGSDSRVYAKNGTTVNVVEGSNNRIFYELQATLEGTGDAAILLPSSGITFVGDISGVDESGSAHAALVQVVPNPAREDVRIIVDAELGRVVSIEVYVLATGERLMRIDDARVETRLDLRGLPSGLYGVRVIAEKGEVVKTLRVEAGE